MPNDLKLFQHSPHPDFKKVEASRPDWDTDKKLTFTKTLSPDWKIGSGANDSGESLKHKHVAIDPNAPDRASALNYKLLISAIVPRPIGFISTRSKDGSSTNLAPFSYTQVVNHDPPIFVVGIAGSIDAAKDTLRNLLDSGECVLNMVSEHFIEAMNSTSIDSPYAVSEWAISGLTPASCDVVKASRVQEAVFAIEGKLLKTEEFESRVTPGKKTGVLAIIEGVRFWAREDAINEERSLLDTEVLRPVSRLGGITYGRSTNVLELPRPKWEETQKDIEAAGLSIPKVEGQ